MGAAQDVDLRVRAHPSVRGVGPPGPVVIATDLTDDAIPALVRGRAHAAAVGAELVVCHVVPDVMRHHPLVPERAENDVLLGTSLARRAAELVNEQVGRVARLSVDAYRTAVLSGVPEEEIVRFAESERASMIVLGARRREGTERLLGLVAERVVRYAHTSVLVARPGHETGKVLVPTDLGEGSTPALRLARDLGTAVRIQTTLVHVTDMARARVAGALFPLGVWTPPSDAAIGELEELAAKTLAGLTKEYGFAGHVHQNGDPANAIVDLAEQLDVEMVIMASRGLHGLARLVLGSVAEKVIRTSNRSVLVVRDPPRGTG